ncbi:MAG: triose-phosphate isomerase [Pirellulales bacterium]|nr:triose-phosphate isomerase [Pirellulales bacterium]
MRRPLVVGNWKMNLLRRDAVALARAVAEWARRHSQPELVLCPPFVYLEAVAEVLRDAPVGLGAQNVYPQAGGAYTGEISPAMLADVGCRYVIVGHSERRQLLGEQDEFIGRKVVAALEAGLQPILCVGELLKQRERGETQEVVRGQLVQALQGVSEAAASRLVLAYEPVWAIGTGRVATAAQAQEVQADLRSTLRMRYNATAAEQVRILYGGSVKAENAAELLAQPDVDGALVGGASLRADEFLRIAACAVA